jgi:hypothetical protein
VFSQNIFSVTCLTVNSTTGTKFVRLNGRFIEAKGFSSSGALLCSFSYLRYSISCSLPIYVTIYPALLSIYVATSCCFAYLVYTISCSLGTLTYAICRHLLHKLSCSLCIYNIPCNFYIYVKTYHALLPIYVTTHPVMLPICVTAYPAVLFIYVTTNPAILPIYVATCPALLSIYVTTYPAVCLFTLQHLLIFWFFTLQHKKFYV